MICPDCTEAITDLACRACGWAGQRSGNVDVAFGRRDLADPVIAEYLSNYDAIADKDCEEGILDELYVRNLADNLVAVAGDVTNLDILDVGVGKAFVLRKLVQRGARSATAVDISLRYLQALSNEPRIKCVQANAENLPFSQEFDLVVTTDVLEHVLNAGSFLLSVHRALRPGGRLIVRVPYRESLLQYSPLNGCPYRFVHLRTFDRMVLRDYLRFSGFSVESITFDGYFVGRPHTFWMKTVKRQQAYELFVRTLVKCTGSNANATLLPRWFANIMMPASEIIISGRKRA